MQLAHRYKTPFEYGNERPVTLVELRMRSFSGAIREKYRWWEKVFDDSVVKKWRQEIVEQDALAVERFWGGMQRNRASEEKQWPRDQINNRQLDYIFDELRYLAKRRDQATGIQNTAIPAVYQSCELVSPELKGQLCSAAAVLESPLLDSEEPHRHLGPEGSGQVLDLVDPSLYCYRIKSSPSRDSSPSPGQENSALSIEGYFSQYSDLRYFGVRSMLSRQHQWIPTDFDITSAGDVTVVTYIHNVHPVAHRELYAPIAAILQRFIPLFEEVLTGTLQEDLPPVIQAHPSAWYRDADESPYREGEPRPTGPNAGGSTSGEEPPPVNFPLIVRAPKIPDPPRFAPPRASERERVCLKGTRLQVIIKLSSIVLTPENSRYPGGAWHVEGMANERIVATGVYCYKSENIPSARLAFRSERSDDHSDVEWEDDHDEDRMGLALADGLYDGVNQVLGMVETLEDKCLAFQNRYQHCLQPFELADPTKPGVRRILCFFLVDPSKFILGTALVPPQQRSWYLQEVRRVPGLQSLPQEVWDLIMGYALEGTMSREIAEAEREKLIEERGQFTQELNQDGLYRKSFFICEH